MLSSLIATIVQACRRWPLQRYCRNGRPVDAGVAAFGGQPEAPPPRRRRAPAVLRFRLQCQMERSHWSEEFVNIHGGLVVLVRSLAPASFHGRATSIGCGGPTYLAALAVSRADERRGSA